MLFPKHLMMLSVLILMPATARPDTILLKSDIW
jgi:hypothetical protein